MLCLLFFYCKWTLNLVDDDDDDDDDDWFTRSSDPYYHFACLSVCLSVCATPNASSPTVLNPVLRNFGTVFSSVACI